MIEVSVLIPTYNRQEMLCQALLALEKQTLASGSFEVIVIDDGSTDGTREAILALDLAFVRYQWQENQGAMAARNAGARRARGDLLVLLDDDILVVPGFLGELVRCHQKLGKVVTVGTLQHFLRQDVTHFERIYADVGYRQPALAPLEEVSDCVLIPYTHCLSGMMSVRKTDYFGLGMMEGMEEKGRGIWGDAVFAYRAVQQGFRIVRVLKAVGYHNDLSFTTLEAYCRLRRRAAGSAALLFDRYPAMRADMEMFRDMGPVAWHEDEPAIILRKLARGVMIRQPARRGLEGATRAVERLYPSPRLLRPLYRWVVGTHICLGYREGLRARHG